MRTALILSSATLALLVACASSAKRDPAPLDPELAGSGAEARIVGLYGRQCAACHGATGEGDGPLAAWVFPPPRPFADGVFSLVSTANGMPTDADLALAIARGLPGTAMPGFGWLPSADLEGLARYVRELGVAGRVRFASVLARHEGVDFDPVLATARAREDLQPGAVVEPLPSFTPTPALLETGKGLYGVLCAACHGSDGRGRPQTAAWRERFDIRLPRDFTTGELRGGASIEALHRRIAAGMPAAGMPPQQLPVEAMQALVAYVRSLLPAVAFEARPDPTVPLEAARAASLPASSADPAWKVARRTLWPLRGDPDAAPFVDVAALHDGRELAVLVSWPDPTKDANPASSASPDAAAVQWSISREPAFLAMGSATEAVQIWQWQAFAVRDARGVTDLLESPLRRRTDAAPDAFPKLRQRALVGMTRGRDDLPEFATGGRPIAAAQEWSAETWRVVFRRPLAAVVAGEFALEPGAEVHLAVAVWNGASGQRGANKAITGWLPLKLAR